MSNQKQTNNDRFKIPEGLVNSGRTSYKNDNKINLELSKEYIGLVIGKGGATINQIRSDTGADIQLKKINGSDNQMAIIGGSESQIRDAEQYIMKVIKRVKNNDRNSGGGGRFGGGDNDRFGSRWNQSRRDNRNRQNYSRDRNRDRAMNNYRSDPPKPKVVKADISSINEFPALAPKPKSNVCGTSQTGASVGNTLSFAKMAEKKKVEKKVVITPKPKMVVLGKKKSLPTVEEILRTEGSLVVGDYLYVGNKNDCNNREWLDSNEINHIINLTDDIPNHFDGDLNYLSLPIDDKNSNDIKEKLRVAIDYIDNTKDNGNKILVHCDLGVSKSIYIIVGYIMKTQGRDANMAYQMVKEKRDIANININLLLDK